ncbi:MAG: DivIVA domain-containing protein [Eubacterium sp.]|nr:DivIVA domain-containing protein [Eubacterium sp.]
MLTPVDIQQKRFKNGLGFDKKDVQSFFDEVSRSYGELYKSNAELKERVITLTDTVQHYKVKEEDLNKTLLRAEKNSQESVSNAVKTAKTIEMEANSRADEIIREAKREKDRLETDISDLRRQFAEYKAKFQRLLREHSDYLDNIDFDREAEDFAARNPKPQPTSSSSSDDDILFGGAASIPDPTPREPANNNSGSGSSGGGKISLKSSHSSAANIYGSSLGGGGLDDLF